ncbi:hydantoinase B/oxoprolinase family protein [Bdellovibrio bacteriovorus]
MNYQVELFHALLNDFLKGESALVTLEGEVLAVRGEKPVTFGTLTTAAATASKYLKLLEGDIVLLNDPYSGGSLLSEMTFVVAVSEDLLWVTRRSIESSLKLAKSIEEEGLRIPPTPILQKNQINEMILQAMASHPACPARFVEWLKEQISDLTSQTKKLHEALELTGFTVTSELIEEYIELSKQTAVQKISELSSGEARIDVVLDSGELLRVNMDIHDGRIALDFGGTSGAKTVSLTESATYGVCFYVISSFYGFNNISNSGSFSILQITKPAGCWLVGKYPAPTHKGMTCGVAALQTALELALAQIHQKKEKSVTSHCPIYFDLHHNDNHALFTLTGGQGADGNCDGISAYANSFSIEKLETQFPVKVQRIDQRNSVGGKGKFSGGRGVIMKLEVTEDVQGTWLTDLTLHRPRLPKNCSHGDPSVISLEQQGQQKTLPVLGQQRFTRGDVITVCSGSGGGFGKE